MNVGVIGAGRIAHIVIPTVQQLPGITCLAIASREKERAEEFAKEHGIPKAYGSYEELLQDPEIDLVYIATPHSHHCEQMLQCIEHGKAVLSEKAFTANAEQAKKVREYAAKKGVFVAEAIWTRYMPSRKVIQEMLDSGIIGEVRFLTANLFYDIDDKERLVRRDLCGGALLDVGVYGLNFALMHFGQDLEKVESSVQMTEGGVDGQENITYDTSVKTITVTVTDDLQGALVASVEGSIEFVNTYTEKEYPPTPPTDDRSNLAAMMVLMMSAICGCAFVVKKKKEEAWEE